MEAASSDLAVFNEYRMALRSRSRYKAMKVAAALRKATDSLTAAHGLLQTVLDEAMAAREDVIESMRCDLEAGMIGLKAISDGLQILIASNERRLEQ